MSQHTPYPDPYRQGAYYRAPAEQQGPVVPGPYPYVPPPVFLVPPPTQEDIARNRRRTVRGLALGAVITGTVSVAIQALMVLLISLSMMAGSSDASSGSSVLIPFVFFPLMMVGIFPSLIGMAWLTAFALSLASAVMAYSGQPSPYDPPQWASARPVSIWLTLASVVQGLPGCVLFLAFLAIMEDLDTTAQDSTSGSILLVTVAVTAVVLVAHGVLVAAVRGLKDDRTPV